MVTNANIARVLSLDSVYGPGAASKVRDSQILVVGAGGVGCELVKNLAISGFGSITLIDLDTIDVSNLNRQFLFRKKHVGKSKANEAAESIRTMVPGTNIQGVMGNVKETRFGVVFFKKFTLVCNALDNLEARRHVNRMCLAAEVPLIESGSTGYNGQCSVIGNGVECYDCVERPPHKSYAVCTIRSTPDKPVHCIVWAKFLYELIFGEEDEGNVLKDLDSIATPEATENGVHPSTRQGGSDSTSLGASPPVGNTAAQSDNSQIGQTDDTDAIRKRKRISKRVRFIQSDTADSFSRRVCERVFVDDIEEQRGMKDLWIERSAPVSYDVARIADENTVDLENVNLLDQTVWSKETSAAVFKGTLKRIFDHRHREIGSLSFDKDDPDAMMFVTSAANLRAHAYGVSLLSPFSAKGIAGNIVHAIASTNAIVGGLIVLEALKITTGDGDLSKSVTTFVSQAPRGSRTRKILCPEELQSPNANCFVCSKGHLRLSVDVKTTSLQTLVTSVLQKKMSIVHPGVHVTTGERHNTLYESGDGLEEDEIEIYSANLRKTLRELDVENGSQLVVEDFAQNLRCTLHVTHVDMLMVEKATDERFILNGDIPALNPPVAQGETDQYVTEDVDDDAEMVASAKLHANEANADESENGTKKKRVLERESVNGEPEAKRTRALSER